MWTRKYALLYLYTALFVQFTACKSATVCGRNGKIFSPYLRVNDKNRGVVVIFYDHHATVVDAGA